MSKTSKGTLRILLLLTLCVVLLAGMSISALAAPLDLEQTGTLTLTPRYGDRPVSRCSFDIYLVATIDAKGSYTLTDEFVGVIGDINGITTASELRSAAASLGSYARRSANGIEPTRTAQSGTAVSGLELGIYLVIQTNAPAYYTLSSPFLAFVPTSYHENIVAEGDDSWDFGQNPDGWVYSVTAFPKMDYDPPEGDDDADADDDDDDDDDTPEEIINDPDTPLTIPDPDVPLDETIDLEDPDTPLAIPQTGMLQWPIPVLSVFGAGLIAGGAGIGRRKKKDESED